MFTLKLVYDDSTNVSELKDSFSGIIETFNESNYHEKKKAWAIKNACGAKKNPFAAIYLDDKLIKGFYSEANECEVKTILDWLNDFIDSNSKKGWIKIEKVEGVNNDVQKIGSVHSGYTNAFMEGIRCRLDSISQWYITSVIEKIDWKNRTFTTKNSTYKFEFLENHESKNC